MQKSFEEIRKEVNVTLSRSRKQYIDLHNSKTNAIPYKPVLWDYMVM